jgi:hypothetical protein
VGTGKIPGIAAGKQWKFGRGPKYSSTGVLIRRSNTLHARIPNAQKKHNNYIMVCMQMHTTQPVIRTRQERRKKVEMCVSETQVSREKQLHDEQAAVHPVPVSNK